MCEFKVYLKDSEKESIIAEGIVYARIDNVDVILKGVIGDTFKVENAKITEVDVSNEVLRLVKRN